MKAPERLDQDIMKQIIGKDSSGKDFWWDLRLIINPIKFEYL